MYIGDEEEKGEGEDGEEEGEEEEGEDTADDTESQEGSQDGSQDGVSLQKENFIFVYQGLLVNFISGFIF